MKMLNWIHSGISRNEIATDGWSQSQSGKQRNGKGDKEREGKKRETERRRRDEREKWPCIPLLDAFNCITHPHLRMRNRACTLPIILITYVDKYIWRGFYDAFLLQSAPNARTHRMTIMTIAKTTAPSPPTAAKVAATTNTTPKKKKVNTNNKW